MFQKNEKTLMSTVFSLCPKLFGNVTLKDIFVFNNEKDVPNNETPSNTKVFN